MPAPLSTAVPAYNSQYAVDGTSVPCSPFLASIIRLFLGAKLVSLGINGAHLARMYFRNMGKPTYLIRSRTVCT